MNSFSKDGNFAGQKFGALTVLRAVADVWLCECECGTRRTLSPKDFRWARKCGRQCPLAHPRVAKLPPAPGGYVRAAHARKFVRYPDLRDMVFGKLTVLSRIGSKRGAQLWLCRCACGEECSATTHDLRGGKKADCGLHLPLRMDQGVTFLELWKEGLSYSEIAKRFDLKSRNIVAGAIRRAREMEAA